MKIMVLGPRIERRKYIFNFSGVWSYYLPRALKAQGVDIVWPGYGGQVDHAIIINRGWHRFDLKQLRGQIRGLITQTFDRPCPGDPVDLTFSVRAAHGPRCIQVGWAADPELCQPNQSKELLRILIDHPDYVEGRYDISAMVANMAMKFKSSCWGWPHKFNGVEICRIVDGGIENVYGPKPDKFTRKHISYPNICREYAKAHLFVPTHRESVGLTVLETAMCGALPIVQKTLLTPELLGTVRHVEFGSIPPFAAALQQLDIAASRSVALCNNWANIANTVITALEGRYGKEETKDVARIDTAKTSTEATASMGIGARRATA